MRMNVAIKAVAVSITIFAISIIGCTINSSCCCRNFNHHAKKQCNVSSVVIPGGRLFTDLTYSDITVVGQETSECTVDAVLSVSATSQEIADSVADQLRVELVEEADRLAIVVQKPAEYTDDYNISAEMNVVVPMQTYMEIVTTYGGCRFENIQKDINVCSTYGELKFDGIRGDIVAKTTYGGIRVENTQCKSLGLTTKYGKITAKDSAAPSVNCLTSYNPIRMDTVTADSLLLTTKYGAIELTQCTAKKAVLKTSYQAIRGEIIDVDRISVQTSYGPIDLKCVNATNPDIVADLKTSYNSIEFCPPAGFAGSVSASTSYGKIRTDFPVMVQGDIGDHLTGTIGQGTGAIAITDKYGNITLKSSTAK